MTFHDEVYKNSEDVALSSINYLFLYYGTIAPVSGEEAIEAINNLQVVCDFLGIEYVEGDQGVYEIEQALQANQPQPIHHEGKEYWPDVNGWYDIESAPRDGTDILVYDGYNQWVVYWDRSDWFVCYEESLREGSEDSPTHWQPLPEEPVNKTPKI